MSGVYIMVENGVCMENVTVKNIRSLTVCGLFAALITAGAYITIPIPYVPITLQTFFVMMAGLLLGKKLGGIAVTVYVVLGLIGLPVFAGGAGGIGYIMHPTFGYILGFIPAAYVTGFLSRQLASKGIAGSFFACFAGTIVIYLVGVPFLYLVKNFYLGVSMSLISALKYGFLLTLPGDIIKCALACAASRKILPAIGDRG